MRGSRAPDGGLQVEGHLDLGLGGGRGQVVPPQVHLGGHDAVGADQAGPLVGLGEGGVVPGFGQRVVEDGWVEGARRGEPHPPVPDDPDPHAEGLGRGERLDLTVVGLGRQRGAPGDERLELLSRLRPAGETQGQVDEVRHRLSMEDRPPLPEPAPIRQVWRDEPAPDARSVLEVSRRPAPRTGWAAPRPDGRRRWRRSPRRRPAPRRWGCPGRAGHRPRGHRRSSRRPADRGRVRAELGDEDRRVEGVAGEHIVGEVVAEIGREVVAEVAAGVVGEVAGQVAGVVGPLVDDRQVAVQVQLLGRVDQVRRGVTAVLDQVVVGAVALLEHVGDLLGVVGEVLGDADEVRRLVLDALGRTQGVDVLGEGGGGVRQVGDAVGVGAVDVLDLVDPVLAEVSGLVQPVVLADRVAVARARGLLGRATVVAATRRRAQHDHHQDQGQSAPPVPPHLVAPVRPLEGAAE